MFDALKEYPLEDKWTNLHSAIGNAPVPQPTGITRDFYLDLAERIARVAVTWQDKNGVVIDPYFKKEANSCTARFVGALGQLIKW